ncbi:uncharacterized protein LOC135804504 [Sycon ciliatum]|uniref:uncharacterized protein LOC135804504 n=1 Tax=Sycon ciliatum TaxID=27933 RepID=UPI0020ABFA40|eukprot:scpid20122/ scgid8050/ Serine/threonine-protein phosphatase 6 regulatory ankyrin repeat subunit A; Ankyrin repeat domain-containing protein 28; Phosphatase interactor targeting protein hnRNP K
MDERPAEDSQVAEGAVQNIEEAIRIGRTDVVVRTIDIAISHLHDGQAGVVNRVLNRQLAGGNTCLHLAVLQGHSDIVRALLRAGADPALRNTSGRSAYELATTEQLQRPFAAHAMEAIAVGNMSVLEQILSSGMSVNHTSKDDQFNTLLHWACRCGTLPGVKLLLSQNAKLDVLNGDGFSPLHEAVKRWDVGIVQYLMECGADADTRVDFGPKAGSSVQDLVPAPHSWSELNLSNGGSPSVMTLLPPLIPANGSNTGGATDAAAAGTAMSGIEEVPSASAPAASMSTVQDEMEGHPLQVLWPPPSIVRCVDGPGFEFRPRFPALYHLMDSTEPFSSVLEVFTYALPMFEESCRATNLSVLPTDGGLLDGALILVVNSDFFSSSDSYNLTISQERIRLEASDLAGLWYGIQTLAQLLRVYVSEGKNTIPPLYIRDWPDLLYRGVMLDLMQGRLPTLDTLKSIIVTMSSLKLNTLQLRMGATSFAYVGLEGVWTDGECYTASQMQELSTFAQKHFVSLVPHQDTLALANAVIGKAQRSGSQESFDDYRDLAGALAQLQQQLFACMPGSKFAHVGLDQPPNNLFPSSPSQGEEGDAYEGFLWTMHKTCRLNSRHMQVWGSELQIRYSLLSQLPPSVTVMQPLGQFTQEKNAPFCRRIVQFGSNLIVCPDSLAKESIGGRPHTSMAQLVAVAQCATHYRATGMMLTDFADFGHVHPLVSSTVPLVSTAGLAWRTGTPLGHLEQQVPNVINRFVLMDEAEVAGQLLLDLQLVHSALLCPHSITSRPSPQVPRSQALSSSSDASGASSLVSAVGLGAGQRKRGSSASTPVATAGSSNSSVGHNTVAARSFLHDDTWWQPALFYMSLRPDKFLLPPLSAELVQSALREVRHCQAVLANVRMSCAQSTGIMAELSFIVELFMFVCRASKQLVLSGKTTGSAAEALASLSPTARTDLANRLISVGQLFREAWLSRNMHGSVDKASLFFQRTLSILHNNPS